MQKRSGVANPHLAEIGVSFVCIRSLNLGRGREADIFGNAGENGHFHVVGVLICNKLRSVLRHVIQRRRLMSVEGAPLLLNLVTLAICSAKRLITDFADGLRILAVDLGSVCYAFLLKRFALVVECFLGKLKPLELLLTDGLHHSQIIGMSDIWTFERC